METFSTLLRSLVTDSGCVFSDSSVLGIEELVMDAVIEHNKLAASVDT